MENGQEGSVVTAVGLKGFIDRAFVLLLVIQTLKSLVHTSRFTS